MRTPLILILLTTIIWCCEDKTKIVHSETYLNEELAVYDQLLDNLLDSISSRVRQQDNLKQVFYLRDTLIAVPYEYLDMKLKDRIFSIGEITRNSRHRFVSTGDTLTLNVHEIFAREWLTISRVSLDKSMSKGGFLLETWCGDLCGAGYHVEIEKKEGKWAIKRVNMIWVS